MVERVDHGIDPLAGRDRPGETDFVYPGMLRETLANLVAAGQHVENTWRQNVTRELAEQQGRKRRVGRWLKHHGVASQQPLRDFMRGEADRHVPRRDRADHAEWPVLQRDAVLAV